MGASIFGPCNECGRHSHCLEEYNERLYCPSCLNKKNIDWQWLKDYKKAIKDLGEKSEI